MSADVAEIEMRSQIQLYVTNSNVRISSFPMPNERTPLSLSQCRTRSIIHDGNTGKTMRRPMKMQKFFLIHGGMNSYWIYPFNK